MVAKNKQNKRKSTPTAMVQVHEVLEELSGATLLLEAQVQAGLIEAETRDAMFRSVMTVISRMEAVNSKHVTELTRVANSGPWTAEQKRKLQARSESGVSPRRRPTAALRKGKKNAGVH